MHTSLWLFSFVWTVSYITLFLFLCSTENNVISGWQRNKHHQRNWISNCNQSLDEFIQLVRTMNHLNEINRVQTHWCIKSFHCLTPGRKMNYLTKIETVLDAASSLKILKTHFSFYAFYDLNLSKMEIENMFDEF